ncbi:MAG: MFS transporter [Firmicutes bacterium]|nr:MFS transporter [Bacillota bacterium]
MEEDALSQAFPTLWHNRRFLIVWIANLLSLTGSGASTVAVSWWVLQKTGSATLMAGADAMAVLTMVLLSLPAGVIADRVERRRYLAALEVVRGLVMLGLTVALLTEQATVPIVYFALVLDAAGLALFEPTLSSLWPQVVPVEQLPQANGLIWMTQNLGRVLGPALGGLLVAGLGVFAATAVDAFSYGISALGFLSMGSLASAHLSGGTAPGRKETSQGPRGVNVQKAPFLAELKDGLRWIAGRRPIVSLLVLASVLNLLFTAAIVLLPVLAQQVVQAGPQSLGWLQAGFSSGAMLGGLLLGLIKVQPSPKILIVGIMLQLLALAPIAWSMQLGVNVALLVVMGFFNASVNATVVTLVQWMVPLAMMGRVFGAFTTLSMALTPIGQMMGGVLADRFPLPWIFTGAALVALLVCAAALLLVPDLLRHENGLPTESQTLQVPEQDG